MAYNSFRNKYKAFKKMSIKLSTINLKSKCFFFISSISTIIIYVFNNLV